MEDILRENGITEVTVVTDQVDNKIFTNYLIDFEGGKTVKRLARRICEHGCTDGSVALKSM
jgi:hypothetical protein